MRTARGFSLLEVVFAVAIVVTALLGLQAAVTGGIDAASSSINRRAARELCRTKLEEILSGFEEPEGSGEFEDYPGFQWEATREEMPLGMPEVQTELVNVITVTVTFPVLATAIGGEEGGEDSSASLELSGILWERKPPQ